MRAPAAVPTKVQLAVLAGAVAGTRLSGPQLLLPSLTLTVPVGEIWLPLTLTCPG